jgi:DNA repair exonuclease SbcCD ATPase subunit
MINFKKVKVQNFLSIGKDPVELNINDGLNIILGENKDKARSNGSGKSTIVESIYFAMFGKTIRGLNKSDVVNKKTKKGTEIVLEFSKGKKEYKIVRKLKPSSLEFHVDGKDVTRDSINNTQEDIEKVIGVSEDVIKNCVIMGINQTVPFMAQSKVEKRKFIEGIFDMNIFSEILKEARKDYNESLKNLTALESKKTEKEKNLEIYKEQSEKFEENKLQKIEKIKEQIKEKQKQKKELESKIIDIDKDQYIGIKDKKQGLNDKILAIKEEKLDNVKEKLAAIVFEINNKKKQIDNLFTSGICPTCNREMSEDDKEHVQKHVDELQADIVDLTDKKERREQNIKEIRGVLTVIETKIRDCDTEITKIQKEINENEIIKNRIQDCDTNIKSLLTNAKEIKEEFNDLEDIITKVGKELSDCSVEIEETTKQVEILDQIKFICGENGVKSYIVNKLLDIFNKRINFYLDKLNANCVLTFDEFFEEKIINDKRHECSYFNFSSGERRNIDIAIMFAFMDLQKIQGKFDTNMLCFDELVDGSLDTDGVNFVVDILLDKCNNEGKSIYLITHRKELQQHATGDIIKVVKQNGISRIEK